MNAVYGLCTEGMDAEALARFDAALAEPVPTPKPRPLMAVPAPDAPPLEPFTEAQRERMKAVQDMGGELFG